MQILLIKNLWQERRKSVNSFFALHNKWMSLSLTEVISKWPIMTSQLQLKIPISRVSYQIPPQITNYISYNQQVIKTQTTKLCKKRSVWNNLICNSSYKSWFMIKHQFKLFVQWKIIIFLTFLSTRAVSPFIAQT